MQAFDAGRLIAEAQQHGERYHEFVRVPAMSLGIYRLPKGSVDTQTPHREDEVYCVLEGRASFRAGSEDRRVGPGAILYVGAGEDHRFHDIEEDLALLVLFSPAEGR
jgi:mannose-6-phosphate isomerase-like protein (cupin superfamily)